MGLIFGAVTSRFWLYRKHMNYILPKTFRVHKEEIPFYAWECLTIEMNNRKVALVIKKESQMMMLIKFIVYRINSVDGIKDTGLIMEANLIKKY